MRSSFAVERSGPLIRTPNARRQAQQRRLAILCAVLGLALASGIAGALIRPADTAPDRASPNQSSTGPFSYFPR